MIFLCRYLQLHNQLKVLVITDQTTEKAAAALSVRVGKYTGNFCLNITYCLWIEPDHESVLFHLPADLLFTSLMHLLSLYVVRYLSVCLFVNCYDSLQQIMKGAQGNI